MQYKMSLIGFHNPYLHKGLSPEEFLSLYIKRKKGNYTLNKWIKEHWNDQIKFVARLFPQTLDTNKHSTLEAERTSLAEGDGKA